MNQTDHRRARERKRAALLEAALKLFGQYGYRRTSIDDIAREADIAKGTVYLSFASKEDLFRALCAQLITRVEDESEKARALEAGFEARLYAVLAAKYGYLYEIVHSSAHAAELMDSKNRLSADLFEKFDRRYVRTVRAIVSDALRRKEIVATAMPLSAADTTALIMSAAHGIEAEASSPQELQRRLRELVRFAAAGLRTGAAPYGYRE